MWNLVLVRLEVVLVSEQDRSTVCAKHTIGSKTFWTHPTVLLVTRLKCQLDLVRLEILLILTQDRRMVCAERGSDVVLDTPDGTPR